MKIQTPPPLQTITNVLDLIPTLEWANSILDIPSRSNIWDGAEQLRRDCFLRESPYGTWRHPPNGGYAVCYLAEDVDDSELLQYDEDDPRLTWIRLSRLLKETYGLEVIVFTSSW